MNFIISVLAVLVSIGSAVAVRAEVTNISTQQKTKVVNRTTIVKNGEVLTKPRSTVGRLKLKVK